MNDCPFCKILKESEREFIYSGENFRAFFDLYPVNEGHTLLIPRRHINNIEQLNSAEKDELSEALLKVRSELLARFDPDGINIGLNEGEAAGQTINHLHWHIIPRHTGDVDDPTGGVRGVIPSKQKY